MSHTKIDVYIEMLEKAKRDTLNVAGGVDEAHRFVQLKEAGATPLWLLGHLTGTMNTLGLEWIIGGESRISPEVAKAFAPDFGGGTPPSTNPGDYPAWDELVALYGELMDQFIDGLKGMDDSALAEGLRGEVAEVLREYFTSNAVALNQLISHDAHHRGQMAMMAKLDV
jgi:hypothetical protein